MLLGSLIFKENLKREFDIEFEVEDGRTSPLERGQRGVLKRFKS